jgi:hypothetical protein
MNSNPNHLTVEIREHLMEFLAAWRGSTGDQSATYHRFYVAILALIDRELAAATAAAEARAGEMREAAREVLVHFSKDRDGWYPNGQPVRKRDAALNRLAAAVAAGQGERSGNKP